ALHHVTQGTRHRVLAQRAQNGEFVTLADLVARAAPARKELEALVLSGACDGLAPLSVEAYPFAHEAVLGRFRGEVRVPSPARLKLYRGLVRANNELRFLGMHPTRHPMELLREEAARAG